MTDFVIEKGVPLTRRAGGRKKGGGFTGLLSSMEVGDSVFCKDWKHARASGSVTPAKRQSGFSFAVRSVEGGVRIWRTA